MTFDNFFKTTPEASADLAEKLKNDPALVLECKKKLEALDRLLRHGEDRCHISRDQRNYLRRMLAGY